jgi:hypothetical protein
MKRTDYHGKRGSNAGDDFHELWAARRSLELISPGSDLVALTVEGVSAEDANGIDDALWDGVDAAFYYGPDVDSIERVEIIQFKYSGSQPDTPWTIARLTHATNSKKTNALIARLASAWRAMSMKRPALDAAGKLTVKLVSNQPADQEVFSAVTAQQVDPSRERLRTASGLDAKDFDAFLLALSFDDCGDKSRFSHEERVIRALSELKAGNVTTEFAILREYIRKRMRPEGADELITAESIYGLFGHADSRTFYPCPTKISPVEHLILRDAVEHVRQLFFGGTQKVCLAGTGGEGKTTCLQALAARLPQGSELIIYDCYGEGTYLNSNGYRHRAEDAFLQLSNEVSARLQFPPLLMERGTDHPRRFANRLAAAAEGLAARGENALLVVAIDAADNAVTAATQCIPPELPFVHNFIRLGDLPPNVRLLLSTRAGRLPELNLPEDVVVVSLGPFSASESRVFSTARLGEQADDWHAEFHTLSGGNPRVQRYAIEFSQGIADRALDYLKPNGKSLNLIFVARMSEARTKTGGTTDLSRLCAALIILPRPVPLKHVAAIVGSTASHVRDLIHDLAPGLALIADEVGFADEDFEQFIREAAAISEEDIRKRAADWLMAQRTTDSYASMHVASLALLAHRRDDVIKLARESFRDYPINDPALRGDIHRRRLRTAMHVCQEAGNAVDAAALLLEGAQAIKTDDAIHKTLLNHVELAANFSRDALVSLILRDPDRRPAHGELLLHLAGIDGLIGDRVNMRTHFRSFLAWQESRADLLTSEDTSPDEHDGPAEQTRRRRSHAQAEEWSLTADDVAAMIVGQFHTAAGKLNADLLRRPRPARFRRSVFRQVIRRLARRADLALLEELLQALPKRHPGRSAIDYVLALAGRPMDVARMVGRAERAAAIELSGFGRTMKDHMSDEEAAEGVRHLLDVCDLMIVNGGDRDRVRAILTHAVPESARTAAALAGYSSRKSDVAVRAFALARVLGGEQVEFDDFTVQPPLTSKPDNRGSVRKPLPKNDSESERAKARELYAPILSLHETRARILVGEIAASDAANVLAAAVKRYNAVDRYRSRPHEWRTRDDEMIRALIPLGAIPGIDARAIFELIQGGLGNPAAITRSEAIAVLEHASVVPDFRDGIVQLSVAACEAVRLEKVSAQDKIDQLTDLAKLLLPIDASASNYCFRAAMDIAGEVDYDTLHSIGITATLAKRGRRAIDTKEAERIALQLATVEQDAAVRLGSSDYFPWDEIAASLTVLAPQIGLAAAARFAEIGLTTRRSFLASVLQQCAADDTLDDATLCGFLPILGENGGELAEHLLVKSAKGNDSRIADEVIRQLTLEPCGSHDRQVAAVSELRAPDSRARQYLAAAAYQKALPSGRQPETEAKANRPDVVPAMLSVAGINGVASFLARIDDIIDAEGDSYLSASDISARLLANVPPYRVAEFLDILVSIPKGNSAVYNLASTLIDQLELWSGRVDAARWARNNLLTVIENRLPELVSNIRYGAFDLDRLIKLTGAPDTEVAKSLLRAVERHVDSLSALRIYRLVELLCGYLSPHDTSEVLKRHVEALHARVAVEDRQLPGFDTVGDVASSVARLVYSELGSISQRDRWRAAHALRVLGRLGQRELIDDVRARYPIENEPAFSHPKAPFYFTTARLWFMLAMARVAWETSDVVFPLRDWLFEQAERSDFPHLLIREAAKQALEGLVYADPEAFTAADRTRIARINTSPLAPLASSQRNYDKGFDRHQSHSEDQRQFRFDSMDTLPYLYTPLMRCFSEPDPTGFLDIAERWIVDKFGATGDVYRYDQERDWRFNRSNYENSHHSHGSLPAVERYRNYLEWNAMFLAGGTVLNVWPLTLDTEDDTWDRFANWLSRRGLTLAPIWLSDLRGPKPLELTQWQAPNREKWLKAPARDEVRYALGLNESEWLIVSCSRSVQYGELRGTVRSESSLVSSQTATSLRLALEASENHFQYRLAVGGSGDHEIDTGEFVLKSILVDHSGDIALDIFDPLRGEIGATDQLPHPEIVELLGLIRDGSGLPVWRDQHGVEMIKARAWSDPARQEQQSQRNFVQGEELLFRRTAVARILEAYQLDMITEVTFNRQVGESSYGKKKDRKREREFDRLFIFRRDGTVESRTYDLGNWT